MGTNIKQNYSSLKNSKRFLFIFLILFLLPQLASAAVDRVICVPWQGDVNKYHTTWTGQSIYLKAVVHTTSTDQIWYRWNYGDGTESAIFTTNGRLKYNLEAIHVYTGAEGTPFTAKLIVADNDALANAIEDPYLVKIEAANLDSKINVAIDNGLWYLYKSGSNASSYYHTFDGSPLMVWSYSYYYASPTASVLHAFQINGHKESSDFNEDPYAEYVEYGLNWLFNGYYYSGSYPMLRPYTIGLTGQGHNADSNANGIGIEVRDYGYRPVYEGGMIIDAIIASGTPDEDSGRDFDGDAVNETYREVVQDMLDQYAWGQYDNPSYGGWRYNWNQWGDNSACQWAAIGMIPAQEPPWNCTVPEWVKDYNDNWLNYTHYVWNGGLWGGFGYTSASYGDALTPSGMVQLNFVEAETTDLRWVRTERWFADNWVVNRNWLNRNNVYAYYAFAKAMRLALPTPVVNFSHNNLDWYRGDGITMGLAEKIADRLVGSSSWDYYGRNLGTAWSVIILKPVLFAEAPVACFDADPNPSYPDVPITFDPSCSTHSEPGKDIADLILFEWDYENDGTYDASTPMPVDVDHAFACASIPCTYQVKLRVTDNSDPARTATYVTNIQITNPPHPPVAVTEGPYMVSLCSEDTLAFDGSGSYDPDEGQSEAGCGTCEADTITAWDWDLTGAPWEYNDESGEVLDLGTGFVSYFGTAGSYDVGLRVTDNTALAYPGSQSANLTDEDFSPVDVYDGCICELTAVPGCQYVMLSWDDVGADEYIIFVSTSGPNSGFEDTSSTAESTKIMGSFVMGQTTWYRVMAVTGNERCLSDAVAVYADEELCNPTADANGPYTGCTNEPVTLDGSGSNALAGTLIAWEWDLDNDGGYDDAFGETVQATWSSVGNYIVGLQVTSSDSLTLQDETSTTVTIEECQGPGICGDLDKDGDVDASDYFIFRGSLRSCIGDAGYIAEADYDLDGCITFNDYRQWYTCYKQYLSM